MDINTQNFKTISLITLGMAALSATNPSQSYGQGKIYETTANLNLREGVGTNYNIILTINYENVNYIPTIKYKK